jgi:hypothetical protein
MALGVCGLRPQAGGAGAIPPGNGCLAIEGALPARSRNYDFGYVLASGNTMVSSLDVGRDMPLCKIWSQRLDLSTARSSSGQSKSAALGAMKVNVQSVAS